LAAAASSPSISIGNDASRPSMRSRDISTNWRDSSAAGERAGGDLGRGGERRRG
jgi:hypothetical protein